MKNSVCPSKLSDVADTEDLQREDLLQQENVTKTNVLYLLDQQM